VNDVYWIYGPWPVPHAPASQLSMKPVRLPLAIVLCPRGGRHLHGEMLNLHRAGIDTLVSLLSQEQVEMLELKDEGPLARRVGMQFLHHPIPDHQLPPDPQAFRSFVEELANRLRSGQRIGIHCWGSIGRATVTAACTLIHLGWSPVSALAAVEAARGCPVPDTEEQQLWILDYKAQP
jgi:protein-tyrosine phosphatase